MSKKFYSSSIVCEKCGTHIPIKGQILPKYKVCPNCKHKTYLESKRFSIEILTYKGELKLL